MLVSRLAGAVKHQFVHLGSEIVVRPGLPTSSDVVGQRCAFVNLEEIERKMLWPEPECFIEISTPRFNRLSRQSGYQIETNVVKSCLTQITERLPCVCRSVRATQTSEFPIVERLRAKTRTLDTKVAKVPEHPRRYGSGIHFHGNFSIRQDFEAKLN